LALFAVSSAGDVKWAAQTGANIGLLSWPAIAKDGTIYYGGYDESSDAKLWATSPAGTPLWHAPLGGNGFAYPALDPEGNVYVPDGSDLWSYAANGTLRWRYSRAISEDETFNYSHLAIGPSHAVFASWQSFHNSNSVSSAGISAFSRTGTLLWDIKKPGAAGATSPVVDRDGNVFVIISNTLYAFSPTGQQLWSFSFSNVDSCNALALGSNSTTYALCASRLIVLRDSVP
jgi:outer membrane protein assembly factor BamB